LQRLARRLSASLNRDLSRRLLTAALAASGLSVLVSLLGAIS
jgi:hypothetical protein